jgi:hypothetical protein
MNGPAPTKGIPMLLRFALTVLLAIAMTAFTPAAMSDDAALSSLTAVTDAVAHASSVMLSAYTLSPSGRLARALRAAVGNGAAVSLTLDGEGTAQAQRENGTDAPIFRAAGIRTTLSSERLHLKALTATDGGGTRVFISDRNWSSSSRAVVLELPGTMAGLIKSAIDGRPMNNGQFATRKSDALALELALLRQRRGRTVLVESESFGDGPIAQVLAARARAGDDVTLVIARYEYQREASEQRLVAALGHAGVHVYIGSSDEKIAIDSSAGYCGSANATTGWGDQIDWGYVFENPQLIATLAAHVRADAAAGQLVTR